MTHSEWNEAMMLFTTDKSVADSTRYNYIRLLLHFWNSYGKHVVEHEPLRLEHVSQFLDKIKPSQVSTFKSAFRKFAELYHTRTGKCAHLLDITQMHPLATEIAMLVEAYGSAQKLMYTAIDQNLTNYPPSPTIGLDYFPDRPAMFKEAVMKVIRWGYPKILPQLGDPLLVEEPGGRTAMHRTVILKILRRSGYDFKFLTKHGYFFATVPTGEKIVMDGIQYSVVKSLYKQELETNTLGQAAKDWQQMLERSKRSTSIDYSSEKTELHFEDGDFKFMKPTFTVPANPQEALVQPSRSFSAPQMPVQMQMPVQPQPVQPQPFQPQPLPQPQPQPMQPQGSGFSITFVMPPDPPGPVQMQSAPVQPQVPVAQPAPQLIPPQPIPPQPQPQPAQPVSPQQPVMFAGKPLPPGYFLTPDGAPTQVDASGYQPRDYPVTPEAEQQCKAALDYVNAFDPMALKETTASAAEMQMTNYKWAGLFIADRQQNAREAAAFEAAQEAAGTAAIDKKEEEK